MSTLDTNKTRKLSDQDVRDILHLANRLSIQCAPEQIALAAAIPGHLVTFAEEHDVSLKMLQSILGKLVKTQALALESIKKRGKNKGVNEAILLAAYNELALDPESGLTEGELLDKALEMKGAPTEQKARSNMRTNFIRALHVLARDGILTSKSGMVKMISMVEKEM